MASETEDASAETASKEGRSDYTFIGAPSDAPTTFADTCLFVTSVGTTVRLQMVELVPGAENSTSPGMKVRYVHNIVMPLEGFHNMLDYFIKTRDQSNPPEAAVDAE